MAGSGVKAITATISAITKNAVAGQRWRRLYSLNDR